MLFSLSLFLRTAGPEIFPSQTYDYDALTSFALNSGQLADWSTTGQADIVQLDTGRAEVANSETSDGGD